MLLSLNAVAGCNSVLGIEPAELGETSEPLSCNWLPTSINNDCPTCDEYCAKDCKVEECLNDPECRNGFWEYRKCVGDGCTDSDGQCGGCISKNARGAQVAKCLKGCGNCDVAGAASLCQGYCACMHAQCSDNEPNAGGEGGCLTACMRGISGLVLPLPDPKVSALWQTAPASWQIGCFWKHCETALHPNDDFHCNHAIGDQIDLVCQKPTPPPPGATLCEYPKGYGNAPCNTDKDCCATCNSTLGICRAPG